MLCIYYKQGFCEKGKKCKFSHDLAVERKGEKKNLYQDTREGDVDEEKKKDDMVDWDEGLCRRSRHMVNDLLILPICRETATSSYEQTRQSKNHYRQSVQILHRCR